MRKMMSAAIAASAAVGLLVVANPMVGLAAPPSVVQDDGAFVRMLGNPADGTAKFQFGWSDSTPASDAAGYWIGIYDVTNSHYVWWTETGPVDLPSALTRNARPTPDLPNGDYKVVFFVRAGYEPTTNISEIELYFTVADSMM
jgi:hypothetical protein